MNKLFCVLLVVLCPFFVNAEKALSKDLVQALEASLEGLKQLTEAYPDLEKTLEQNMLSTDKDKVISTIKSLPSYPKIKAVVSSAGFKNIEEYYDISTRVMGAMFAFQANQMPEGMTVDAISNIMKMQVDNLKKQGAPKEVIAEMEKSVSKQVKSMQAIINLSKSASAADKEFAEKNALWLMQILSMTDDDMSEDAFN